MSTPKDERAPLYKEESSGKIPQVDSEAMLGQRRRLLAPPRRFGPRMQMLVFPIIGLVFAILHHFYYQYLSGRSTDSLRFSIRGRTVFSQEWAMTIGNALAYLVRSSFVIPIGKVFVQRFWKELGERPFSLRTLNAIMTIKSNPLSPRAFGAWRPVALLSAVALASTGMATMTVFAPGALSVEPADFSWAINCEVPAVDLTQSDIAEVQVSNGLSTFRGSLAPIRSLAVKVLMAGGPSPPSSSPCGICKYNTTFSAPALNCTNITSSFNFPPEFTGTDTSGAAPTVFWNASYSFDVFGSGFSLLVLSRQGSFSNLSSPEAIQCTAANATYVVGVEHSNVTAVDATSNDFKAYISGSRNRPTTKEELAFNAIADAFGTVLSGTVISTREARTLTSDLASGSSLVAFSPLGRFVNNTWSLTDNLLSALPSLVHNITVTMLAGNVSSNGAPSLASVPGLCYSNTNVYKYDRVRLLATYAAGLFVTIVCVVLGLLALRANGMEESMNFSRFVDAILTTEMFTVRDQLQLGSEVMATRGQLAPRLVPS